MEAKKNPHADVHQHRSKIFLVGLMISLSIVITAFEWRTAGSEIVFKKIDLTEEPLPFIQITQIDPPKVIAPPPIEKLKQATTSTASLNPTLLTEVPDNVDTKLPDFDLENPLSGTSLNIEPDPDTTSVVVVFPEQQPKPVGGYENFYRIVSQNTKYPRQAQNIGTEGKVFVEFIVDRKGNPTNLKIIRGIGSGCDEEAIRVAAIPKWEPGKQRGKAVNVKMVLPINFILNR